MPLSYHVDGEDPFSMPMAEQPGKLNLKTVLRVAGGVALALLLALLAVAGYISALVPELFRLNRACQEEGYYMAAFEFKMLGFAYQLDKGRYAEAISGIRRLRAQLKSRNGLHRVPRFSSKEEELEFYLALQNPRTGAFMDDGFPYCTYDGPTQNVLLHLEGLAKQTGKPLRLRYPLKYLDRINTPATLTAYLNDVSRIGWIAARFPQTSFHFARELLEYCQPGGLLERNHLYAFSPEWKTAMLRWFHAWQDPETGMWGPKSRAGKLLKTDLNNTSSIVKAFVDADGNDIYPSFPLRFKREMFASVLKVMSRPPPGPGDLDEWHERALAMGKAINLLTRYLWKDASAEHKRAAAKLFENYLREKFDRCFVASDGAFSYYPDSRHATLDGASVGIGLYIELGAFSGERQRRLWGGPERTCADLGRLTRSSLAAKDLEPLLSSPAVNSIRFYRRAPDASRYAIGAAGVFYPRPAQVLDAVDLVSRVRDWLNRTPQSMGNWVSREELSERLRNTGIDPVPVTRHGIPLASLNQVLQENRTLTLVGFDVLQVPRCALTIFRDSS